MSKQNKKSIIFLLFSLISFLYLEMIFQIFNNKTAITLYSLLFSLTISFIVFIVSSLFKPKTNYRILLSSTMIITLIYIVEIMYIHSFKKPLTMTDIGAGNVQIIAYYREIIKAFMNCLPTILLLCIPVIFLFILKKTKLIPPKKSLKSSVGFIILTVLTAVASISSINMNKLTNPTLYENYHQLNDVKYSIEQFGLLTTLRINTRDLLFGHNNDIDVDDIVIEKEEEEEIKIDTSPNIIDIPFEELSTKTNNKNIKKLNEYFASLKPTQKNEYTGMFKGYNLIHITAEAFSPYCISEELTPTLYKLTHSGFIFNNFYVSATTESTCGGESMNMTGLLLNPKRPQGVYTIEQAAKSYMPFTMGNQFSKLGIQPYAYHNNSLTYYNRINTIPKLGYHFKASTPGSMSKSEAAKKDLLFDLKTKSWPQSDLEMIQATTQDYITNQPFHAYYMSVSGHSNYYFKDNSMSKKNKELVDHLELSEPCKGYIAAQIEFDRALEELIRQLEENNQLDNTVICFTSDHFPYGLTHKEYEELAGHKIEENFEIHKNSLVLWNNKMDTVVIDKPCSSIDILPTLNNLFGFTYDSRLLPGKDILSTAKGFVYFTENNSFMTDTYIYNNRTRKTYDLSGNEIQVDEKQLEKDSKNYKMTVLMNRLMIENKYYNTIKDYIK